MDKFIEIDGLTCSYGKNTILTNISLEIKENEIVFLMGNNGCGKTTLLKYLLGFLTGKAGAIKYSGRNLKEIQPNCFLRMVSYVPQNINIGYGYRVKDYLILGRNPYIKFGNPGIKDFDVVEKYAVETGILNLLNQYMQSLSGGQKQWVAITRALVQETPILYMDEPMSALDLGKQAELLELLLRLKKQGKTMIVTSHNPLHSLSTRSKVCMLHNKNILRYGQANEVLSSDIIAEVYGNKIDIDKDKGILSFDLK